jgi:uncharacterized protein
MQEILIFVVVGFLAQMIDGALGMAYGVVSSTTLLALGVTPAHASAAVHAAEVFTTAAAGTSHLYHRNVDWALFWRLMPFGVLGGCTGAYVLTSFEGDAIKPFVTGYLAIVGATLVIRSFRKIPAKPLSGAVVMPLGAAGGFLDAAGGGGWGPIVTTGLLGAGGAPRYVIGTVSAAEFLITTAVSIAFLTALLTGHWAGAGGVIENLGPVAGLIIGGVLAAPLAGLVVKRLPERGLLLIVGTAIVLLAGYQSLELWEIV